MGLKRIEGKGIGPHVEHLLQWDRSSAGVIAWEFTGQGIDVLIYLVLHELQRETPDSWMGTIASSSTTASEVPPWCDLLLLA